MSIGEGSISSVECRDLCFTLLWGFWMTLVWPFIHQRWWYWFTHSGAFEEGKHNIKTAVFMEIRLCENYRLRRRWHGRWNAKTPRTDCAMIGERRRRELIRCRDWINKIGRWKLLISLLEMMVRGPGIGAIVESHGHGHSKVRLQIYGQQFK